MAHTLTDRALALAGLFQAVSLVQRVARHGSCDTAALDTCVASILNTSPSDTAAVYGGAQALRLGLDQVIAQLGDNPKTRDVEVTRYAIALLHLERQLAKHPPMLEQLMRGIERARGQVEHFSLSHSVVLASLAGLYGDTISTLTPRIMVNGEQNYLSNPEHANKIRALLLAGVRAGVLWRQCGGTRWQLLFGRGKLVGEASRLRVG